jgi:competence protein ComFC
MLLIQAASLAYDSLLALVYPQSCAVCNGRVETRALGESCASCWQQTRVFNVSTNCCWKCGRATYASIRPEQLEQVRCHTCDLDAFSAARACGVYEGALRAAVLSLKREPNVSRKVVDLLVETHRRTPLRTATRIVPVPLHPERERERGFNQACVLGRALSLRTFLPLDEVSLVRTSHTHRHRAGMDAKDRHKTVENAFRVSHPALIADERVLLIDDVFTTGATVSSCASALLEAGAAEVFVLTLARPMQY